jgi:hypothetical protein
VAAGTFGDCWRRVRLYVPAAPTFLCREWVNVAYKRMGKARHWSFLRGETRLTINAARTIPVCTVTRGSATVTSAGLFLAGDAGRQFRVKTLPIYTVQTFTDVNTIVLDQPYGEDTSVVAAASIFDGYATLPADFESFRLIADPYTQRRLAYWISEDQVNVLDPTWSVSDSGARCLVARGGGSTYTPTLGAVQYQYWPRPTAARSYPAIYNKQAALLTDTSVLRGVLADQIEVLVDGALAEAALWPGTQDLPNRYFNPTVAQAKRVAFLDGVQHLSLRDDDQAPDDLATVHWEHWPLADLTFNDVQLRATDATVGDFF